jgi:hypothetical protein
MDSMESEECWRGDCLVPDCGWFSEKSKQADGDEGSAKALNRSENHTKEAISYI